MEIFSHIRFFAFSLLTIALRLLSKISISPKLFKEILTSASIGYASHKIRYKEYNKAFNEVASVVDFELPVNDPYLAKARYTISYLYYYGLGTEENKDKAKHYIYLAAEGGNQDALNKMVELGLTKSSSGTTNP